MILRERICPGCAQTFYENISPVFAAELCAIATMHDMTNDKNIQCLSRKQEIYSCKMFVHKTAHICFLKTLEKIFLASIR